MRMSLRSGAGEEGRRSLAARRRRTPRCVRPASRRRSGGRTLATCRDGPERGMGSAGARCDGDRCCMALGAGARGLLLAASRRARPRRRATRCCATRSGVAETGFDPAQISRPLFAHARPRTSSRRRYTYDYLARPVQAQAADRRRRCPRSSTDFRTLHVPHPAAASSSPTTRPSRASARAGRRRTTSTAQALLRPALKSPSLQRARERRHRSAWTSCASARSRRKRRSTTTARSRACARSIATRCSSGSRAAARRASCYTLARRRPSPARSRARSSSATATTIMEHPVGTGPFRLRSGGAARDRARDATRAFARSSTTPSRRPTTPTARRRPSGSRAGGCR